MAGRVHIGLPVRRAGVKPGDSHVLFMVIEHFDGGDVLPVYRRLSEAGRGLPEGVRYVDSWMEAGCRRCFQLMETDDAGLLQDWALHWRGCGVSFEIVPVVPAAETRARAEAILAGEPVTPPG